MSLSELSGGLHGVGLGPTFIIDDLIDPIPSGDIVGPERTLMAALLFDGLQSYINYQCAQNEDTKRRFKEAHLWVHSADKEYIFSFENVCESLGIDPGYLRIGLINACNSQLEERKKARRHF